MLIRKLMTAKAIATMDTVLALTFVKMIMLRLWPDMTTAMTTEHSASSQQLTSKCSELRRNIRIDICQHIDSHAMKQLQPISESVPNRGYCRRHGGRRRWKPRRSSAGAKWHAPVLRSLVGHPSIPLWRYRTLKKTIS